MDCCTSYTTTQHHRSDVQQDPGPPYRQTGQCLCRSRAVPSFYADDSAIRRVGPNPGVNRRHLQSHLDRLKKLFDEWGFKVSAKKTLVVEFRRSRTQTSSDMAIQRESQTKNSQV